METQHTWMTLLKDLFGVDLSKTPDVAKRWIDLLRQGVNTNTDELCDVLIWVSDQPDRKNRRPDCESLKIWVKWYRKMMSAQRGMYGVSTDQGRLNRIKSTIKQAGTELERWNIMCSPEHYIERNSSGALARILSKPMNSHPVFSYHSCMICFCSLDAIFSSNQSRQAGAMVHITLPCRSSR